MRVEVRKRSTMIEGGFTLTHHDLLVIAENQKDSAVLDLLGDVGSRFIGEVRLADGYGEHYLLIQPKVQVGNDGEVVREFA